MRGALAALATLAIVAVLVLGLALTVVPVQVPGLGELRLRCTVGITGTRASVTARGLMAGTVCRRVLDGTWGLAREESGPDPGAAVVCSGNYRFGSVEVLDLGLLDLVGRTLCTGLAVAGS